MSRDLQCLDSTPVDSLEVSRSFPQQHFNSRLNSALTFVAQEVSELLQQAYSVQVDGNNPAGTNGTKKSVNPWYHWLLGVGLQVRV
ncbi:hypothetical protein WKK05_14105 [Nostoc sp. UHCC 0302]|uniref:hypothetical protein n=1 Tax=Nostoc sp. UHCC 0302 TaxID=3134896 RepID=UPI00311CCC56